MSYNYIIAVDPGVVGAISIAEKNKEPEVYRMPVMKVVINKKEKKAYDLSGICALLRPYIDKNVLFIQESVNVLPGQGNVSGFAFGQAVMATRAIAVAFGFKVVEVRPALWKSHFPQLESSEIVKFREEIKALKNKAKEIVEKDKIAKQIKDKDIKKQNRKVNKEALQLNKKEIEKIARKLKENAKANARQVAAQFYPTLRDRFVQVNSDGLAEAILILRYAQDNYDKLVQET